MLQRGVRMKKLFALLCATLLLAQIVFGTYAWQIERLGGHETLHNQRTDSATTDGTASVGVAASILEYDDNRGDFGGADLFVANVSMTANSRGGINYDWSTLSNEWWINETDLDVSTRNTVSGAGDDVIWPVAMNYPARPWFNFRFYGGPGYIDGDWTGANCSAEFQTAYVSTNGFVSFDNNSSPSPVPGEIPSTAKPNGFVAGVWNDLNVPSSSSITTGLYHIGFNWYFVVIYRNIVDKSSNQVLTFEIILQQSQTPSSNWWRQSEIYITYHSVHNLMYYEYYTWGIESLPGNTGIGGKTPGNNLGSRNGKTCWFHQTEDNYYLKRLTLQFNDANQHTRISILKEANALKGYNIMQQQGTTAQPDPSWMYATTLEGAASLLAAVFLPGVGWVIGAFFIADAVCVTSDIIESVDYLAYGQRTARDIQIFDQGSNPSLNNFGNASALTYDYAVDASMSLSVSWILDQQEVALTDYSLTITAMLEYSALSSGGVWTSMSPISTTITLGCGPDHNNDMASSYPITDIPAHLTGNWIGSADYPQVYDNSDWYNFYVSFGQIILVSAASDVSYDTHPYLSLFLYNSSHALKAQASNSETPSLTYTADSLGTSTWYIQVMCYSNFGYYSLDVSFQVTHGGCPYVYDWNGTNYIVDNNLLPSSEKSNGSDVQDYYRLEQSLVPTYTNPVFSVYGLQISEFEHEHSYLDQMKLYTIDHNLNTNVAVSPTGQILTYGEPRPPILVQDENGRDWLQAISMIDGVYYQSTSGDYLTLYFGWVNSTNAKLVFREDLMKDSIHVQVQMVDGSWLEVTDIPGRVNWAMDIVDLQPFLQTAHNPLAVRLYFTVNHRIDFVGLDTSPQASVQTRQALMIYAVHSVYGNVLPQLMLSDNQYAELTPDQEITLNFLALTVNPYQVRTFILYVEGHYYTIQQ
jgi:hypothetical protein